jgi:adenylylsulfate kinase
VKPGVAVWITGLPASGKTTLGSALVRALRADGAVALLLDGDDLRRHVAYGFDDAGRERLYGLLAHVARLASEAGATVVVSATAHRRAWRDAARASIPRFFEVYLAADAATCAARDPKGLWRAAAEQRISALPGAGVAFEPPLAPELVLAPEVPLDEAVAAVRALLG